MVFKKNYFRNMVRVYLVLLFSFIMNFEFLSVENLLSVVILIEILVLVQYEECV